MATIGIATVFAIGIGSHISEKPSTVKEDLKESKEIIIPDEMEVKADSRIAGREVEIEIKFKKNYTPIRTNGKLKIEMWQSTITDYNNRETKIAE